MSKAGLSPWMKRIHEILPDDVEYEKDGSFFEITDENREPPFALSIWEIDEDDFIVTGFQGGEETEFGDSYHTLDKVLDIVKQHFPVKP